MRILIPDARFHGDADIERAALQPVLGQPGAALDLHRFAEASAVPAETWRAADAVIISSNRLRLGHEQVMLLDRCRLVVRSAVGVDNIDLGACARRNIPVCNVPDYGTEEVANHAIGLMLSLRRGLVTYTEMLAADPVSGWRWDAAPLIGRLSLQRFGIIGLGRIGRAVAQRARAFGFRILYYDPYVAEAPNPVHVERADTLEALLSTSDIVSLHVPLADETRGMIGAAQLARMKPGSILINTARGAVVDIDALPAAIKAGRPGAVALDVLPQEPPDPDHELIAAWRLQPTWLAGRLILTPHAAFYSPESLYDMRHKAAQVVCDALLGHGVRNCVNEAELAAFGAGVPPAKV